MPPRRSCFSESCFFSNVGNQRFNATTAFLLRGFAAKPRRVVPQFQCHHGVPASRRGPGAAAGCAAVSMPPRRSCFREAEIVSLLERYRFNATTAFLLLNALRAAYVRRVGFNATTAFLLRASLWRSRSRPAWFQCHHGVPASWSRAGGRSSSGSCFNATTAFLLPGESWRGRTPWRSFQCHHGVPASPGKAGDSEAAPGVSMPPRRSCFGAGVGVGVTS